MGKGGKNNMAGVMGVLQNMLKQSQPAPKAKATPKATAKAAAAPANPNDNWKSVLNVEMGRKLKRPLTKEDFTYTTDTDSNGKFVSTLMCPEFEKNMEYVGAKADTEKAANHEAAKKAVQGEFPQAFSAANQSINKAKAAANVVAKATAKATPKAAAKAAAAPAGIMNADAKSGLNQAVQVLLARPVAAGDINYETTQDGEGKFSATVQIAELEATIFKGVKADSKKAAETSAAEKALIKFKGKAAAKKAAKAAEKGGKPATSAEDKAKRAKIDALDDSLKVWVGGLPKNTTSDDLKKLFSKCGAVQMAERMGHKPMAIVVYKAAMQAQKAINTLNGTLMGESTIQVDVWTTKK